jgi:hypothetical protein
LPPKFNKKIFFKLIFNYCFFFTDTWADEQGERLFSAISLAEDEHHPTTGAATAESLSPFVPLLRVDTSSSWDRNPEDNNAIKAQTEMIPPDTGHAATQLSPQPPNRRNRTASPSFSHRSIAAASSSAYSDGSNVMSETREDLLQGIRAMDDSIQTLKAEMNKLLSVYESVRLQPEERPVTVPG